MVVVVVDKPYGICEDSRVSGGIHIRTFYEDGKMVGGAVRPGNDKTPTAKKADACFSFQSQFIMSVEF